MYLKQGFGSVTIKPDLLDTNSLEKALIFKMSKQEFINNTSNIRIP